MEKQRGRKAVVIELDEEERQTLERWIRRRSTAQGLAMRSRIVLGAAEGRTNVDIAAEVGCSGLRSRSGGTVSPGAVSTASTTIPGPVRPAASTTPR